MDNDDVVRREDLATVRAATTRTRRFVLGGTLAVVIASSALVGVASHFLVLHSIPAATFIAVVVALGGSLQLLRWWRHYRSIFKQLDSLERRLTSGEVVHGSQVTFHTH